MKYEGDVNYAADPYGYRPPAPQKRRGLLGLGLAVGGIVAFTGVILVGYGGSDRMSADGTPPLLTADATPAKSRPEQPGGLEVPHQDKLVFDRLNDKSEHPKIERLLPPPETPLPRPVVTPSMPPPPPLPAAPSIAQMPPPPPGSTATVPRDMAQQPGVPVPPPVAAVPSTTASQPAAKPANAPAKPAQQQAAAQPAAKPVVQQAAAPAPQAAKPPAVATASLPPPAAPAAPAPQPAKPAPVAAAPAPAAAAPQPAKPTATAAGGSAGGSAGWRVQLASVRSEAEASAEWKRLQGKHADALGGLGMQVIKADLGDKGVYYRVQGTGLDENRAKSVCAQLRAQSVGCVVVRP